MATFTSTLVLLLTICFLISTTSSAKENHKKKTIIHFIDSLPVNSEQVILQCGTGEFENFIPPLNSGDKYQVKIERADEAYSCMALWGLKFTSWNPFEMPRDASHKKVIYLLNEDGIFIRSYKSSWDLIAPWETE